jgi:hypothetical protein
MRSERGQATVEWVGIVLLVALALAALSHFAPKADGRDLGDAVAASVTRPLLRPAARSRAPARQSEQPFPIPRAHPPTERAFPIPPAHPPTEQPFPIPPAHPPTEQPFPIPRAHPPTEQPFPIPPAHPPTERAFPIPPLIPRAGAPIRRQGARSAALRIRLPRARTLLRTARAGAGRAWRRAWIACLVYERFRYALLHPESRFPGHTIPPSEVLRMVNDCISPLDLVRDWPELTR